MHHLFLRQVLASIVISTAAFCFTPASSFAQDNWSADDDSFEARKIERYQQLVDQSPEKSYAFNQLMATVGKGAAYQKLLADYEKKADAKPQNFNLRMILGHMYQHGGRTNDALAAYKRALEIKQTPLVYIAIGEAEAENRNFDPAVAAYEAAANLNPSREQKQDIWRALAEIAIYRRDMERAKTCFAELIKLEPNSLFIRRELSQIYRQNHMFDDARNVLKDALKIASSSEKEQIELDIAALYEEEGNDDEALKRYEALSSKLSASHWMQRDLNSRIIEIYRRKGAVRELAARFEKQWKSPSYQQHLELADLYNDISESDKALEHIKKAVSMSPKLPEAHEKLIQHYRSHGQIDLMFEARKNLIKQIPDNPEYRFALYEDYLAQKKLDLAIGTLDETLKKFTADFDVQRRIADQYLSHGRGQKTLNIYESWLKKHPGELEAYEALGDYYDADGQRKKALATWQKIESLSIDQSTKLETLARIYAEHGYIDEAENLYKKYVDLNAKDCFMLSQYADLLTTSGKINEAITAWEKLAQTCPNDATMTVASRQIANLHESRGMADKALLQYRGTCEANPRNYANFLLLAAVAKELGKPEIAIPVLEERSTSESGSVQVLKALSALYADAGQLDNARLTLEKMSGLSEADRREVLIELAEVDVKAGHSDLAVEHLKEALKLNGNDSLTYEMLGDVQFKRRLYEEAVDSYETAFQIDNKNWQVAFKSARALSILRRLKEADALYLRIIRESSDEAMIRTAALRALDDHVWLGTLDEFSTELLPILRSKKHHELNLEILLSVAEAHAEPHVLELKTRDSAYAVSARHALRELANRYSSLLVEAALSTNSAISGRAIRLSEWMTSAGMLNILGQKIANAPVSEAGRDDQITMMRAIAHAQLPGSVAVIKPFLGQQYSRALREHTLWALGLIASPEAAQLLTESLNSQIDSIRALSIIGLGRRNASLADVHRLLKSDPSNVVKDIAAWVLAYLHYDRAYPDIRKFLRNNAKKPHQIWALQQVEEENSAEELLKSLWCGSSESRSIAAQFMRSTPSTSSISTISLVEVQGRAMHGKASQYLSNFDFDLLLDHFSQISMTSDEKSTPARWIQTNRAAFVDSVAKIAAGSDDKCRIQMLSDLILPDNAPRLNVNDISLRPVLIDAVQGIKPFLLSWVKSSNEQTSRELASLSLRALSLSQDPQVLELAADIAQNGSDMALRLDAISAIAGFKSSDSAALIRKLCGDSNYLVRAAAVSQLNPNNSDDVKILKKAADDSYILVSETAKKLLEITLQ